MPIDYVIDHDRRLVLARGHGTLTHEDVFGYQREVWSRPEVNGYNELVDMSQVVHIALQSVEGVRELANLSAGMDARSSASKFAIVAPVTKAPPQSGGNLKSSSSQFRATCPAVLPLFPAISLSFSIMGSTFLRLGSVK